MFRPTDCDRLTDRAVLQRRSRVRSIRGVLPLVATCALAHATYNLLSRWLILYFEHRRGFPTSTSWLSLLLLACTGSKIEGLQTVWLVRNWLIWRSVPSVLKCSPTLEFCRVSTRSVSSAWWTTATTDNRETTCLVHYAGKSSPFQMMGYRGRRRTSSWRNCFMSESFQPDRKRSRFHVMYAAVMRQVLVKLANLLRRIVSSVDRTTANSAVSTTGRWEVVQTSLWWILEQIRILQRW